MVSALNWGSPAPGCERSDKQEPAHSAHSELLRSGHELRRDPRAGGYASLGITARASTNLAVLLLHDAWHSKRVQAVASPTLDRASPDPKRSSQPHYYYFSGIGRYRPCKDRVGSHGRLRGLRERSKPILRGLGQPLHKSLTYKGIFYVIFF